jgi:hypothetical protein
MKEHEAHAEHIKEENGGEAPERVVYRKSMITTGLWSLEYSILTF